MKLSVIIPCYQEDQATLFRALDSLLFLNHCCDWEAWIIDDGSPHGQVTQWVTSRHDAHLHVIRQENQGQSAARNQGIAHATGDYIALLDADDEWIPETYTHLIHLLEEKQPDLLGLRYQPTRTPYYEGDALAFMATQDIIPAACGYIYRRDALGSLRYTPSIVHEDEEFNTRLHLHLSSLLMTPLVAYRYHRTKGSTTQSVHPDRVHKRFHDLLGIIQRFQQEKEKIEREAVQDARKPLRIQALHRRIYVLAMCYLVNLIRDGLSAEMVRAALRNLSVAGLYPLPSLHATPFRIRRYRWIRLFTYHPWCIVLAWKLLRWSRGK